jgi:hypothetical protein
MGHPNKNNFSTRMMRYLDGDLSKNEEYELLLDLQKNPEYARQLNMEQNFREFIKSKVSRKHVSPMLIDSIKEKIRKAPV